MKIIRVQIDDEDEDLIPEGVSMLYVGEEPPPGGYALALADLEAAIALKADKVGGFVPDGQIPASIARDAEVTAAVDAAVAALVAAAPGALNTLDELAAALGDDANFATTITNLLAGKAATVHGHSIAEIALLQAALDAKAAAPGAWTALLDATTNAKFTAHAAATPQYRLNNGLVQLAGVISVSPVGITTGDRICTLASSALWPPAVGAVQSIFPYDAAGGAVRRVTVSSSNGEIVVAGIGASASRLFLDGCTWRPA